MTDVMRRAATYYDASYPPSILVPPGPPPTPVITSLVPDTVVVDVPTPCDIVGTDFRPDVKVFVDDTEQLCTFVNPTLVRYMAQADTVGDQFVYVGNPDGTDSVVASNTMTLDVTAAEEEAPPPEPPPDGEDGEDGETEPDA